MSPMHPNVSTLYLTFITNLPLLSANLYLSLEVDPKEKSRDRKDNYCKEQTLACCSVNTPRSSILGDSSWT